MSWKMKYFVHVKCHGLERTVREGMVPRVRDRKRPRQRWQQDMKETLNMMQEKAGDLARDR
uniref:Uncharacterized protein n=1 Tax=Arion vulgaris TaxID=1028688 RepID=A0A0B7ASG8_9EUPU